SPASPGAMSIVASPEKIACSALTMSTWKVLAMWLSRAWVLEESAGALLQRLRLLEGFLDRTDHVESLLGQRIALAVDDHLEPFDGVLERHVLARRAGKHF